MNVFRAGVYQSLGGSDHNAAIAADQQRHMSRLLQIRSHPLADLLPRDARTRPTPDGRNRMMRKVAGNCDIALIDRSTAGRFQPLEQMHVAIGLASFSLPGYSEPLR